MVRLTSVRRILPSPVLKPRRASLATARTNQPNFVGRACTHNTRLARAGVEHGSGARRQQAASSNAAQAAVPRSRVPTFGLLGRAAGCEGCVPSLGCHADVRVGRRGAAHHKVLLLRPLRRGHAVQELALQQVQRRSRGAVTNSCPAHKWQPHDQQSAQSADNTFSPPEPAQRAAPRM